MTESIWTLGRGKFESLADLNGGKVPQHEKREFPAVAENSLISDFFLQTAARLQQGEQRPHPSR